MNYGNKVTFQGNPLTLTGKEIHLGEKAPEVTLMNTQLEPIKLSSFKGKFLLIVAVPSLDTAVCDLEARRFNKEAAKYASEVQTLVVSMDLPFAQKRWCGAGESGNVMTLSDYKEHSFGQAFGVYIKELGLLARSIFLFDKELTLRYLQIVPEMTDQPDYALVLQELALLTQNSGY